ncbi:FAD-dependent oxidoreductase [Meiothermus ruber]|jgi:ferredoxin--NADP+ reductase|uniref:FAD-dependent pyridine nucleotide-disulfide oxidoreductase n=1 Tax=Meiothermus ruber (strain ATCC 35948 / DSM 1279 / VKM B-1258 / 21) TaxID=504728 RepID=D3PQE6_MEIRD|nr:FAD-dependent oxidoreductase [Meiothermus ruber]GIW39186.1 MAG: NADP oxidoreductase [Meiothermus sp.]ADD29779.1 FAD-dependent pyridine nucleotide-disulfide oxidoreductase [Meiothermus ruber DSM 1279]AGK04764.1 FAD-dependent pyridine nucleotide-disulfide oxidoreductase [Meiothermus ruber DSM 1279]MCL6529520.1 FAD-dependent oxidoreductase [Meiothermus ruber]GAO76703.1 FAD-dependent pyridine nucleotide-disulfide oxidoreductase [Meiothermus ruber H328]
MAEQLDVNRPLRVAVIGAGPSGIYAAEALIKQGEVAVSVDVFDRLPTPYGLVRYGVAPDHQTIKSVTKVMQKVLQDPRVRFLGNVEYGRDLTYADLKRHYDAVVYTVGASSDRHLNIPGEELPGSLSATEFVAWYNGHPDYQNLDIRLDGQGVAVVGMGNVAVDVTRILAKTAEELGRTDIADHALPVLAQSQVTDIYMLGRRGPAQAKFTTKELRELGELLNADVLVRPEELELDEKSAASIAHDPALLKNLEVLREFAARPLSGKPRRIHIRFFVSPVAILGEGRVQKIRLEKNRLDENLNAVGTGQFEELEVGMVLRSVGYKGVPLPEVPFDSRKGVIPNQGGRVLREGQVALGEYTAGWIKRGPSGVIGTNKADATETIKLLLEDAPSLPLAPEPSPEAVTQLLQLRGVRYVTLEHWLKLDQHECAQGQAQGRPRVKVTSIAKMLELAQG